jgi:hypothetical protein
MRHLEFLRWEYLEPEVGPASRHIKHVSKLEPLIETSFYIILSRELLVFEF